MEKSNYIKYKELNSDRRHYFRDSLSELIVANSKSNPLDLPINKPESFSILFTYLNPDNTIPNAATQYGYINSFFNGFNKIIKHETYDTVLNRITDSIDVFGLGFTLQFMANCFKRLNALSLEDFTKLSTFFHKMWDFNPLTRVINIEQLLNEYEGVLLEIGVLTRLDKSFENNNLVNKPPLPPVIMAEAKSDEKSPPQHLSAALQEFANKDPVEITVKCPEGKEFNPITKICVKRCNKGYETNDKFKCIKTKKLKSIRTKSVKICSSKYLKNEKFHNFTKCYSSTKKRVKTNKHNSKSKFRNTARTRTRSTK